MTEAIAFSPNIFKHPPVQYIPLAVHTLQRDTGWQPAGNHHQPRVKVWQEKAKMDQDLVGLGIPLPTPPVDFRARVVVLVTGALVQDVKYRAHTVYLVGKKVTGAYHLFSLTRRYFYKRRLHFALFAHTGKRLAWDNIFLAHNL